METSWAQRFGNSFYKSEKERHPAHYSSRDDQFNISLQEGVNMVLFALENHLGGEIFVLKSHRTELKMLLKRLGHAVNIK